MEVKIRPLVPEDRNFVLSTWLRNYRHSSYFARGIRTQVFYEGHNRMLNIMLDRATCKVNVVCDANEPALIFGYVVFESQPGADVVHYLYVKKPMRGFGLGKQLLSSTAFEGPFSFTHLTSNVSEWHRSHPDHLYDPYRV